MKTRLKGVLSMPNVRESFLTFSLRKLISLSLWNSIERERKKELNIRMINNLALHQVVTIFSYNIHLKTVLQGKKSSRGSHLMKIFIITPEIRKERNSKRKKKMREKRKWFSFLFFMQYNIVQKIHKRKLVRVRKVSD